MIVALEDAVYPAQTVPYTGTAGNTTGWPGGTGAIGVLIYTSTDAFVKVGEGAVATTSSTPIPAFVPIVFKVPQGTGTWRVSAIQNAAGGTVFAKPVYSTTPTS